MKDYKDNQGYTLDKQKYYMRQIRYCFKMLEKSNQNQILYELIKDVDIKQLDKIKG